MKIRTRLTLWYAVILFGSTLILTGFAYKHFLDEQRGPERTNSIREFFEKEREDWDDVVAMIVWFVMPTALIGLAGGWWLMRKALAPVNALTEAVEKTNERSLGEQLKRSGNGDELDRLTEVFNQMTRRLDASFQQIREFTLHASHELKTPLTVMRGEAETALRDENLPAPQRERLLSQLDELQRLTKIVDGLTLLTKADAGQVRLEKEKVCLDELVRDCFEDAKILAEPQRITVTLEKCEVVHVIADRHRLRQLLLNLTDNAIKYNQPNGTVTISLERHGDQAEIKIANTGAGLPPEHLAHVFERFFRSDQSHNNAVDGCGLGLSIAQWITHAHGGSIRLTSAPGQLTIVQVSLPLAAS